MWKIIQPHPFRVGLRSTFMCVRRAAGRVASAHAMHHTGKAFTLRAEHVSTHRITYAAPRQEKWGADALWAARTWRRATNSCAPLGLAQRGMRNAVLKHAATLARPHPGRRRPDGGRPSWPPNPVSAAHRPQKLYYTHDYAGLEAHPPQLGAAVSGAGPSRELSGPSPFPATENLHQIKRRPNFSTYLYMKTRTATSPPASTP